MSTDTQVAAIVFIRSFNADFCVVIFQTGRRQYVLSVVCSHPLPPEHRG
jgi:hypothetical protein